VQLPILSGIYTDEAGDFRTAYPVNLMPVPMDSGISKGYLRPIEGLVSTIDGPGGSRGGIVWNGICYRVMGSILVSISSDGAITTIGDVGPGGQCSFDFGFDRMSVSSGGNLYYWNGTIFQKVVDPGLGVCLDAIWIDGYTMSTDGEFLVVSSLTNHMLFPAFNYASSEVDPDPINSVWKLRNEAVAVNRNTIEFFRNVGGQGFPFERINGAQITKGSVGTFASCIFNETITFVGGGRGEAVSVYMGVKAQAQKIGTTEIETLLAKYSESDLASCIVEPRTAVGVNHLWIRLPDRTLVYDMDASRMAGNPIWFQMTSGLSEFSKYVAGDLVFCYNKWLVANPIGNEIGYLSDTVSSQWGAQARWEFSTSIVYGEGKGVQFHSLELVCLTGRVALGATPTISTSYSTDGEVWSQPRFIAVGTTGDRSKRLVWFRQGWMRNWRVQRFQGTTESQLTIARLEANLEPLQS